MKTYGKAETESKILIKKDTIQSNDEGIQFYKGDQKSLQEKIQRLSEKQKGFSQDVKKHRGTQRGRGFKTGGH